MIYIKLFLIGILSIPLGSFLKYVPSLLFGIILELTVEKFINKDHLKKFRLFFVSFCAGITVGFIQVLSLYYFDLLPYFAYRLIINTVFCCYVVFLAEGYTDFTFHEICESDVKLFQKFRHKSQFVRYIGYLIGFYGSAFAITKLFI